MVWNWAFARRGVAVASSFAWLVPVASGVLSVLFFGEGFDVAKAVRAAAILAGLIILQQPRASASQRAISFDKERQRALLAD